MALRDILVQLDATEQGRARLRIAADLARQHGAQLIGIHAFDLPLPFAAADAGSGMALADLLKRMRDDAAATAASVEAAFREQLRHDGIDGEWRLVEGPVAERVALHARYADLLVLGQADPEGEPPADDATIEAAMFTSGRPILVIPHSGNFTTLGRRVVIGWNGSREATRAVHDALPLIAGAEQVTVLAVNPRSGTVALGDEPGADIARHLARHGLKVTVERTEATEISAGDLLLNRAADLSADLIVTGAYGHSRVREMILGGVTRTLLRHMTVPVLMSH